MRKTAALIFLILICILTAGCSQVKQVENQAYIIVMGLDRADDGQLEMTVQLPQIAASGESDSGNSGGKYFTMSVSEDDYESALEKLEWAIPRNINLSQLKLLILSEKLAGEDYCRRLIENIVQTERLFDEAQVVVCEDSAKEFVTAMKPVIGERLSTDITAMFESYSGLGYVPDCSLAEFYYLTESVYSDPMAALGIFTKNQNEQSQSVPAAAFKGTPQEIVSGMESEVQTHYIGAALFSDGKFRGELSGSQTIFANLLKGGVQTFRHKINDQSIEITPDRKPEIYVRTNTEPVSIKIGLSLSVNTQEDMPDPEELKSKLKDEIMDVIRTAQGFEVEPFGFAEKAAKHFATLQKWTDYKWKERYIGANFDINIDIHRAEA